MKWLDRILGKKDKESEDLVFNRKSAELLGWKPKWFNRSSDEFNEDLIKHIKVYQEKMGITVDGRVDSETYRRKAAEIEALQDVLKGAVGKTIICNGGRIPIKWDKVILWKDEEWWASKPGSYRLPNTNKRKPTMFMVHWDVCLSSKSCKKILDKRGLSVHFLIDNDGTIIQTMDTKNIGFHAGNRNVNNNSIGVEVSDAYYTKYQNHYEKNGFGPRPIWSNVEVHDRKLEPFLGFYSVQEEALKALIEALHRAHKIPLEVPVDKDGKLSNRTHRRSRQGKFRGVLCHYHITERKIDTAGLELDRLVNEVRGES